VFFNRSTVDDSRYSGSWKFNGVDLGRSRFASDLRWTLEKLGGMFPRTREFAEFWPMVGRAQLLFIWLLFPLVLPTARAQDIITNYAGGGPIGGAALTSLVTDPSGIARDVAGNLIHCHRAGQDRSQA
jgi:hypothetical protein